MDRPAWIVEAVQAREDYSLHITFTGGETRIYDARPLLKENVYSSLRDLEFFLGARAEHHTVVWSDAIDIAPEHLYECSIPVEKDCDIEE